MTYDTTVSYTIVLFCISVQPVTFHDYFNSLGYSLQYEYYLDNLGKLLVLFVYHANQILFCFCSYFRAWVKSFMTFFVAFFLFS